MPEHGSWLPPPERGAPSMPTAPPVYPPSPPTWSLPPAPPPPRRRRVWPAVSAAIGGVVVLGLLLTSALAVWSTRSQVRQVRRDLVTSRDDLRRARGDLKQVQSALDDAQGSLDDLQATVNDLELRIEDLQQRIDDLERGADGQTAAFGPTLGDRLGGPPELTNGDTLGAVIDAVDARCLLGEAGDGALGAPRATPELTGDLPDDVDTILSRVKAIRHATVDPAPKVEILSDAQFDILARAEMGPVPRRDVHEEQRELELLGAVPAGFDLLGTYDDATSGVSGFYDSTDGIVRVRRRDGANGLGSLWEVVLAHELDHALDDANVGLPAPSDADGDAALAAQAIGEGDATLVMQQYASSYLGLPAELAALAAEDPALPAGYPAYLAAAARFPYVEGARYLCYRYLQGGWDRVDRELAEPPATTYEVLFPERRAPTVTEPSSVERVPLGWETTIDDSFGAADLLWLLQAPGNDAGRARPDVRDAVTAWSGGHVTLYRDGAAHALALRLVATDDTLCAAMADWYAAAHPDARRTGGGTITDFTATAQAGRVRCQGDEVHVAIGPEPGIVATLAD